MKQYKIAEVRSIGNKLGRAGISEEVIKSINEFDGSYKSAMELCGKLSVWADAATFDEYWSEQVFRGVEKGLTDARKSNNLTMFKEG